MKIFCVDINPEGRMSFYIKPETVVVRNNESVYTPLFTNDMRYDVSFAVKINRITKAINEKFAPRCWEELSLAINFYAYDLKCQCIDKGISHDIANVFDKSFVQPNNFIMKDDFYKTYNSKSYVRIGSETIKMNWLPTEVIINKAISYISNFLTLKIGDVVTVNTFECSNRKAKEGDHIDLVFGDEIIAYTDIK